MAEETGNCIYCSAPVTTSRGEGDHVIPAALGRFRGEFRFRRICQACNAKIGRCEEQILRCAPEAYVRRLVNPPVQRGKRGKSWVGAHGVRGPQFTVKHDDHHELAEADPDNPENLRPVDQVVVVTKNNQEHYIRLNPRMSEAALRADIEAIGKEKIARVYLHVDDSHWEQFTAFLSAILPGSTMTESEARSAGVHRVEGRTEFRFNADYWRAVAKIGFHYALLNSRRGFRGDEPEFAALRGFIMTGGDHTPFFNGSGARFVTGFGRLPDGRVVLPHVWAHLLALDESDQTFSASVALFMGPKRLPTVNHLTLARLPSPLVVPGAQAVHVYIYDDALREKGYAGRVEQESVTRLR